MSDDLELAKTSLEKANNLVDIKKNSVVHSLLVSPLIKIPFIGSFIDSCTNNLIEKYQKDKEKELINIISKDGSIIISEMVNDVEFIINFNRILEAVKRLATNDKIIFFGNLIKNGYLSGIHIDSNTFDEYLNILNTMSYREIKYITDYKLFCEEKIKETHTKTSGRVSYSKWSSFSREYTEQNKITKRQLCSVFMRIKQTGFVDEMFETESGEVDEDFHSFDSLNVESNGFCIEPSFLEFYDIVLKRT